MTRQTIEFKIASCNLMSLPSQRSIARTMSTLAGVHIWGMQEADPRAYKVSLLKRWPQVLGIGTLERPRNDTYSCPIGYAPGTFAHVSGSNHKLYDGESQVSLTRRLRRDRFLHMRSGIDLGVVNLHSVVGHGVKKADRVRMKAEAKVATFESVRAYLKLGLPVAVTGDFNDTANWFGAKFDGHRVRVVGHGIDKIILIENAGFTWSVESVKYRESPSDHDTLRCRVRLTRA